MEGTILDGPRTDRDETIASLLTVPVFRCCSRRQLGRIARIAAVVDVAPGRVVTRRDDPGREFFCVIRGTATAEVSPRRRRRLFPGDFFGEMSLIDGEPRSATVVADQGMRLLVIDQRHFGALLSEVPDLTRTLLATLSRRVRDAERSG